MLSSSGGAGGRNQGARVPELYNPVGAAGQHTGRVERDGGRAKHPPRVRQRQAGRRGRRGAARRGGRRSPPRPDRRAAGRRSPRARRSRHRPCRPAVPPARLPRSPPVPPPAPSCPIPLPTSAADDPQSGAGAGAQVDDGAAGEVASDDEDRLGRRPARRAPAGAKGPPPTGSAGRADSRGGSPPTVHRHSTQSRSAPATTDAAACTARSGWSSATRSASTGVPDASSHRTSQPASPSLPSSASTSRCRPPGEDSPAIRPGHRWRSRPPVSNGSPSGSDQTPYPPARSAAPAHPPADHTVATGASRAATVRCGCSSSTRSQRVDQGSPPR